MRNPAKAAVSTKYFGATTYKPARIRVKARNLPTVFFSVHTLTDDDVTAEELHALAVEKYLRKFKLDWGKFLMGWTGDEYVHVFIPHGHCVISEKFANRQVR
jgi:hypothetical protein